VVDWRGQRRRRVHSAREAKGKDGSMSGYHEVYRPDFYWDIFRNFYWTSD
jgi:hypothetical protein